VSSWNIVDVHPIALDIDVCRGSSFADLVQTDLRKASMNLFVRLLKKMKNVKRIIAIGTGAGQFSLE
jgi:hypothetical protein